MRSRMTIAFCSTLTTAAVFLSVSYLPAQEPSVTALVPVTMTVTANVDSDKRMPEIDQKDVLVKLGKEPLQVTEWAPAQGDRAGLDLFILIDDASDTSLGMHLDDLRTFINAQPTTTSVGVGYMRNATVQIVQNFTTEHAKAAKALRLPMGSVGAYASPYLSLVDLLKRWPENHNRREVLMVTDGIDRARGGPRWRGLNTNPDVDSASDVAQSAGIIIHTIYAPGRGRLHRNYWEASNGQMGLAKLSDETGGESFFLGLQSPVSFQPYLDELQKILDNQYLLSFSANPRKRVGLQYVTLTTEVAGVEFAAADAVLVPAAK